MAPQASKKCGLLPPDHQRIGSCKSNSINSEQVPGTFFLLTISSLSPQTSAQSKKRFLTLFSCSHVMGAGWTSTLRRTVTQQRPFTRRV
jgi:hypothetical protein